MTETIEMIFIRGKEMILVNGKYIPIFEVKGNPLVLIEGKYIFLEDLKKYYLIK